jgi:hypothetical protein
MRIRTNLSGLAAASSKVQSQAGGGPQIGKVFGVITSENTPTKELYKKFGGPNAVGTIFYLDYDQSKNTEFADLNTCKTARPLKSGIQDYPLIGELVILTDLPGPTTQVVKSTSQKYYTEVINLWNNIQQNSPSGRTLGKTFVEKADIRSIMYFEGDRIIQGRKGNGIRFGSTVQLRADKNEWSSIGNDGDPITILVNGYVTTDNKSLAPNIEEINKELSSIYLTSTQKIPLQAGALIRNPIASAISTDNYTDSQIILNSNRIVLNSKKDDILLNSSGLIEINSDSIININSGGYIHLNIESKNKDSKILLGTNPNGTAPLEPVLLGEKTSDLLLDILNALDNLSAALIEAGSPSSDGGIDIPSLSLGGVELSTSVETLIDRVKEIQSQKVFTA